MSRTQGKKSAHRAIADARRWTFEVPLARNAVTALGNNRLHENSHDERKDSSGELHYQLESANCSGPGCGLNSFEQITGLYAYECGTAACTRCNGPRR
jgi:hypothetical protein